MSSLYWQIPILISFIQGVKQRRSQEALINPKVIRNHIGSGQPSRSMQDSVVPANHASSLLYDEQGALRL
jgi:hypothetical protein